MKQRTKIFLNTAYLSLAVGVISACNSGGSPGDPSTPVNPITDAGTLMVANAPTSVGGNFVAVEKSAKIVGNYLVVSWAEASASGNHVETLGMTFDLANSQNVVNFSSTDLGSSYGSWICSDGSSSPTDACKAITIDKAAGVVTFSNQVLSGQETSGPSSTASNITLNGTLHFTPPSGSTATPNPGPTPVPTPTPIPTHFVSNGINSALLSGAVIGSGTAVVGNLRKQIAATVLGTNTSFTVGIAFATRGGTSSDYAYVILPVTNIGTQTLCYVKLAGITYRDSSGAAIGVPSVTYVNGSVGIVSSTMFTDTCLAPGETGMVADIKASLYTAVAKMEFTFETTSYTISVPAASVIPQSYSVQSTGSIPSINVKNVGSGPAQIGGANTSMVFLLDGAEQPLMWSFAFSDPSVPSVVVPVAGTATIPSYGYYDGSASKLLAFVGFEDAPLTAGLTATFGIALPATDICAAALSSDELMLCRIESRNQRLDSLKSSNDAQVSAP